MNKEFRLVPQKPKKDHKLSTLLAVVNLTVTARHNESRFELLEMTFEAQKKSVEPVTSFFEYLKDFVKNRFV